MKTAVRLYFPQGSCLIDKTYIIEAPTTSDALPIGIDKLKEEGFDVDRAFHYGMKAKVMALEADTLDVIEGLRLCA